MNVYERIKMLRQQSGMSQEELALKSGYEGRSMISRIESGQIDLRISRLEMIADALGVNAAYLAGFDEHQENRDMALALSYLIDKAQMLDDTDLAKLQERAEILLESDKYEN